MIRTSRPFLLLLVLLLVPSCIGVSVGTDDDEFFRMRGLGTAYAAVPGIDDYDGKIIRLGLLSRAPDGAQLAGIDVWPLFSIGVGLVGARVRILPFEIGAGLLFYEPKPVRRDLAKAKEKAAARQRVRIEDDGEDVPVRKVQVDGEAPKSPAAADAPVRQAKEPAEAEVPPAGGSGSGS
jgi:hypothetical protein